MPDPINWGSSGPYFIAAFVFGYLLGSIPFGLLLTRMAGLGDVRSIGSGNIGATNVLRTGNKKLAAATLILDALKGTTAVLLAALFGPGTAVMAAIGAFIGHCYPVWLKFKGGKGVATYLGVIAALAWPLGIVFAVTWVSVAFLFRYSSLAALVATALVPILAYFTHLPALAEVSALLAALLWWRHRTNIKRLLDRTESKIGGKSEAKPEPTPDADG